MLTLAVVTHSIIWAFSRKEMSDGDPGSKGVRDVASRTDLGFVVLVSEVTVNFPEAGSRASGNVNSGSNLEGSVLSRILCPPT